MRRKKGPEADIRKEEPPRNIKREKITIADHTVTHICGHTVVYGVPSISTAHPEAWAGQKCFDCQKGGA